MEQQTSSKSGKEYTKAVYCHLAYLSYMQSKSCEMPGSMKHKLESRFPGEISITSDMQMTPPYSRKGRGTKESLDVSERAEWKIWLKTQHSENEDHGIWSHHFMANRWGNNGNSERLYFGVLQNHCRWWLQPWNSMMFAPWKKSYEKPRQNIKKQSHYFANKGPSSQSYGFSSSHVWMWELDGPTAQKAEHRRIDAFELWCWRRLLRVPWTARRSNQ